MAQNVFLKAIGLKTSPNPLDLQPGSMTEASNVVITRNNVIEARRGFKLYGSPMGSTSDRAKQLIEYKNRILRHFGTTIEYDNGTTDSNGVAQFSAFAGSYLEAQTGLRIKSIEANGNLYFTTSNGIEKISAKSADDFTTDAGYITPAGGIKATDLSARIQYIYGEQNGFFIQDSKVAYRTVWATKDANNNLVAGVPSQRIEVSNPLMGLLVPDFMHLLSALDEIDQAPCLIDDGDYVNSLKLSIDADPLELQTNLISLASKLDADIVIPVATASAEITTGTTATIVYASPVDTYISIGDSITLTGFTDVNLTQLNNQHYTVNTVNTNTITLTIIGTTILTVQTSTPDVGGITTSYNYGVITQPPIPATPATDNDLVAMQNYTVAIIGRLQAELTGVIPTVLQNEFIVGLTITTTAEVILDISIPAEVTSAYFLQIYRSAQATATGTTSLDTITPNDELQQVYEAYPTAAELAARTMQVTDIVLDSFKGAYLYTNAISGEGILQANEAPPFALDINRFKNHIFFANTKSKHRFTLNLLGVSNVKAGTISAISIGNPTTITAVAHGLSTGDIVYIDGTNSTPAVVGQFAVTVVDADNFTVPVNVTVAGTYGYWTNGLISISNGTSSSLYKLIKGTTENTVVTVRAANDAVYSPGNLGGKYFTINAAEDTTLYYVWYNTGSDTDPAPTGRTGIEVLIGATDADTVVADKTRDAVAVVVQDFNTSSTGNQVTITATGSGYTTDATVATSQFTLAITQGIGANPAKQEVLLSNLASPARAVDETARSLIHVINENPSEVVYAFYLSGPTDVPGQILLEARTLNPNPFYVLANNPTTGLEFNPDISPFPTATLTNTAAASSVVTVPNHGLKSGDQVLIEFSNSVPKINGIFTVTFLSTSTFSIPFTVTTAGTTGVMRKLSLAQVSQNDVKPNRVFYSKFLQPEAVPLVNFIDVGAENKAILRIFPLRDSLFVFKEDGLFRISGETEPFNLALFDGSCYLLAPDSVDTSNNLVYCWTTTGVGVVSEAGYSLMTRDIDNLILPTASANYPNFKTATWGVGYKSDNSYLVFTVSETTDTVATICYRFSNLTNSWTTFDKTNTCGIVATFDDKLYMGAGDVDFIEQERKSFDRSDYADRELSTQLTVGNYLDGGSNLKVITVEGMEIGDVVIQNQKLSIYDFNVFLQKLDLDPGVWPVPISAISTGSTVTITTSTPHGLNTGEYVVIQNSDSTPIIDGDYQVTVVDANNFTIVPENTVFVAGVSGIAKYSYFNNLQAFGGDDMRDKLVALANKLDQDPGISYNQFATLIAQLGPTSITANTPTDPTVITATGHGLVSGRVIQIGGSNSVPLINGQYTVTVIDANHFSIPVDVSVAGTSGTFNTISTNANDIRACFNAIITQLNIDPNTNFKNYMLISTDVSQEAIITAINTITKILTVNLVLDFVVGDLTIFKAIKTSFTYAPITMGDSLSMKLISQATLMFENKAFTKAIVSFASDLLPMFNDIPFNGDGNGIFGFQSFGSGFFGGASNSAPFITYIPRANMRNRYLVMRFQHSTARERYAILGASMVGNIVSTRAYR